MKRDTHELRLDRWPSLSTFPTTNGVIVAAIILDFLTMFAWALGREVPDGWLLFLASLHGIGTAHFGVKRYSDFRNGGAKPEASPTPTPAPQP